MTDNRAEILKVIEEVVAAIPKTGLFIRANLSAALKDINDVKTTVDPKDALWALAEKFITDQRIHCGETIYQTDRVIENGYEFMHEVCKIVGFFKDPEDSEDDA